MASKRSTANRASLVVHFIGKIKLGEDHVNRQSGPFKVFFNVF